MKLRFSALALILGAFAADAHSGLAQQSVPPIPQDDSSFIDAQGTAHITRVVPLPKTVSPQALPRMVPVTYPEVTGLRWDEC
jgi:monoterpene epsilon-lactone hydrolase